MKSSLLKLLGISILLFGIHFLLSHYVLTASKVDGIYQIHLFLGIATLLIVFVLEKIRIKNQAFLGQAYLVSVVLKMLASIVFLLPKILGDHKDEKLVVIHFFSAFFIYLFIEVFVLVSSLKK